MDDPRPDALLDETGRAFSRLGLQLAWTDGVEGPSAKACTRSGSASWKTPKRLSTDPASAGAFFLGRARKHNPAVPVGANGLCVLEIDLDLADGDALSTPDARKRVSALWRRLELPPWPRTMTVRSRRGVHIYLRANTVGAAKVQIGEDTAVTWSNDGYLVAPPALHPSGVVYEMVVNGEIADVPLELYTRLAVLADETRVGDRERLSEGEEIPEGRRRETIFSAALAALRDGQEKASVVEAMLRINDAQCRPRLDAAQVRSQVDGAVRHARRNPTETERARELARRALEGELPATAEASPPRKRDGRALPFSDVVLSGPPAWIWRGKIPRGAVTLIAGRPKLGKSLLTIWLAGQLSHGLLPGDYQGKAARTLIIAAEDPPDPIIKGRLIAAAADESMVLTLVQGSQDRQASPGDGVDGLGGLDGLGSLARRIVIPDEYRLLEQIVVDEEIVLVVLDPLNSFISAKVDAHRDTEIRRVLDPLSHIAARRGFAALAVVHLNRRTDRDVLNRITGSGGYGGSARSILTFGRHPEDENQRVVAAEGNWQREAESDLFEKREVVVWPDAPEGDQTQPVLVHAGTSPLSSGDVVDDDDERGALAEAKEFLMGELAFAAQSVSDLKLAAEANGVAWRTVERAKPALDVQARRISVVGSGRGSGRWEWYLDLDSEAEQDNQKEERE